MGLEPFLAAGIVSTEVGSVAGANMVGVCTSIQSFVDVMERKSPICNGSYLVATLGYLYTYLNF